MKRAVFIFLFFYSARFAHAVELRLNANDYPAGSGDQIAGMIRDIYRFALAIGGILAFGAIVFGAIKWTVSQGNTSQISDAKQWITDALLGLLLLAGATLILQTINPEIVKLDPPTKIICESDPSNALCKSATQ